MEKIAKITSYDKADRFFWWLSEHAEVTRFQGFVVDRLDDGRVSSFVHGSLRHCFDIDYIWAERKMINDWIDAYNKRVDQAAGVPSAAADRWVYYDRLTRRQDAQYNPANDAKMEAAFEQYNGRYDNGLYLRATQHRSAARGAALSNTALAMCGSPYDQISDDIQWSKAERAFLALFQEDWAAVESVAEQGPAGEESEAGRASLRFALLLALVVLLALLLAVVVVTNTTLFEDGSIQFFNRAGWGFCLVRSWGC